MIESITNKETIVVGVQLALVVGVTMVLARRDGVTINWFRIAFISAVTFAVLTGALMLLAGSGFATRSAIVLTLFGSVAACLVVAWMLARKSRPGKADQ